MTPFHDCRPSVLPPKTPKCAPDVILALSTDCLALCMDINSFTRPRCCLLASNRQLMRRASHSSVDLWHMCISDCICLPSNTSSGGSPAVARKNTTSDENPCMNTVRIQTCRVGGEWRRSHVRGRCREKKRKKKYRSC